jgi:hypothetical protein
LAPLERKTQSTESETKVEIEQPQRGCGSETLSATGDASVPASDAAERLYFLAKIERGSDYPYGREPSKSCNPTASPQLD